MSTTIRLSLTPKLNTVLNELKEKKFSFLENSEIIKTILAEYYATFKKAETSKILKERQEWIDSLPEYEATEEEEKAIGEGIEELERGDYITIKANDNRPISEILNN